MKPWICLLYCVLGTAHTCHCWLAGKGTTYLVVFRIVSSGLAGPDYTGSGVVVESVLHSEVRKTKAECSSQSPLSSLPPSSLPKLFSLTTCCSLATVYFLIKACSLATVCSLTAACFLTTACSLTAACFLTTACSLATACSLITAYSLTTACSLTTASSLNTAYSLTKACYLTTSEIAYM